MIVSRSFATQQFSRRPRKRVGSRMGVGSDYPELADFFPVAIFSFKDCCQPLCGGGLGADNGAGNRTKRQRWDSRDGDFSVCGRRFYFGNITVMEDLGCLAQWNINSCVVCLFWRCCTVSYYAKSQKLQASITWGWKYKGESIQEIRAVKSHRRLLEETGSFPEGHLDWKNTPQSHTHTHTRTKLVSSVSYASRRSSQLCPWGRWLCHCYFGAWRGTCVCVLYMLSLIKSVELPHIHYSVSLSYYVQ